mmetsp:Transcript_19038/g.19034  ORF Transcript_19038/g.19034 Transcript_19038/m.19034 type:complete len:82 (+) Transcript_19038:2-247(+)
MPYSLLCLSNNSAIKNQFGALKQKFLKLYKRKANVHHYTNFMEASHFDEALRSLDDLIGRYNEIDIPKEEVPINRIRPLVA